MSMTKDISQYHVGEFSILNEMNLVNLIISHKAYNLLEIYGLNYDKWFIDVQLDNLLFELFLIIDPITYKCIVHNARSHIGNGQLLRSAKYLDMFVQRFEWFYNIIDHSTYLDLSYMQVSR